MTKKINVQPVVAAGGIVHRKNKITDEVLLIKRNGFWDLPKGKTEGNESVDECAIREVEEETDVKGLSIRNFLCETYHEYRQNGIKFGKTTHWYLMATSKTEAKLTPQAEEGITDLKWVQPAEALRMVDFPNLKRVLQESIRIIGLVDPAENKKGA
jgi:8-oxo-dGTP pyrophosphatase MutT (NUDIX family)